MQSAHADVIRADSLVPSTTDHLTSDKYNEHVLRVMHDLGINQQQTVQVGNFPSNALDQACPKSGLRASSGQYAPKQLSR